MSGKDQLLACYKGDEFLGIKTAREWAEARGCKIASVLFMASPAHKRRCSERAITFYRIDET